MPSVESLCELLGVSPAGADPITRTDLKTVRTYRQALQVGLIRRRPAQYSRKWLADRLGKSVQTVWRYNRDGGVTVTPMFQRIPLYFHNIKQFIPEHEASVVLGTFLEDHRGKRYPVKYGLAMRLIKQGGARFVKQEVNYYSIGEKIPILPPAYSLEIDAQPVFEPAGPDEEAIASYWQGVYAVGEPAAVLRRRDASNNTPSDDPPRYQGVRVIPQHDPQWLKQHELETPHEHLTQEQITYWTDKIYEQVNRRVVGEPEDKRISKQRARSLITQYGVKQVKKALWILDQRDNIVSPAGFLIVVLRSNAKRRPAQAGYGSAC